MAVEQKAIRLVLNVPESGPVFREIDALNEYLEDGWIVVELEQVASHGNQGTVLVILERSE